MPGDSGSPPFYSSLSVFSSGNPATDVSRDKKPESKDADKTIFQSTLPITVAVPMVAIAVCAIVFTALIPAAFSQSN